MAKVRVGIIGCGMMGNCYAAVFPRDKDIEITSCCDPNPHKLKAFSEKYHIPHTYTDYRELIEKEELNLIGNATPDHLHSKVSDLAMQSGLAVFSEKPMTSNLIEARALSKTAEDKNLLTGVNFSKRSSAALIRAKELIENGSLGELRHIEGTYKQGWIVTEDYGSWKNPDKHSWTWRLSSAHQPLGVLGDLGSHLYDMAEYLAGPIAEISCRMNRFDKGMEKVGEFTLDGWDSFYSSINFTCGASGFLSATRWATGEKDSLTLTVHGSTGSLRINYAEKNRLNLFLVQKGKWENFDLQKPQNQYQIFLNCLKNATPYKPDYVDGCRNQLLLEESLRSHMENRTVSIS
ncbi:MAG: Gfo/Idh/MocA family oxidoreductase [Spirochaetales bacterium]|nr:Gfo/Idh/MocA family oxidoreductase [Spirochaetales bacterium]